MSDYRKSIVIDIDGRGARTGSKEVQRALDEIDRKARAAGINIDGTSGSMHGLGTAAKAAMAYFSVSTMANFAKSVLDAGVAMDSLQRSFVAISGSQGGAASQLAFLRQEADRLGQNFYTLAPAFKNISAAATGTALEGQGVREVFSSIVEASTALGMSNADTEGALRALAQMMSKGTVQAEELRGQLGERLPGAFQIMARALGKTTPELNKMLEQGEVLSDVVLPALAKEITSMYGAAAQTAALESGQAAINKMSEAWTDFKTNLYDSDQAVQGINAITNAIKTLTEYAGLRSISETFAEGAKMAQEGKLNWEEFKKASYMDRQRMVDSGGPLNTFRGTVNRNAVMPAYSAPKPSPAKSTQSVTSSAAKSSAEQEARAAARAHEKMIEDGQRAASALEKYWNDYEQNRVDAIADTVQARAEAQQRDLQLVTEFADKYKEIVLGETEFKMAQIEAQADAYRSAGADEIAVAKWVEAEKLKYSRDWKDGATRALQAYADEAGNSAMAVESVMNTAFQGMEDMIVEFVKTGKFEFADFVTSINAEIARLAFKSLAGESYSFLGDLLKTGMSAVGSYFSGGTAVSSAAGSSGVAGTMSSLMSRSAHGNVFTGPGISEFSNTIVTKPTKFWANGGNLMGEDGPEAIMPLKRMSNNDFGVKVSGGSDAELKGLVRELIAVNKAQKAQKNVFAFDKRTVANELSGSEGEQMTLTHVRRNQRAFRAALGL